MKRNYPALGWSKMKITILFNRQVEVIFLYRHLPIEEKLTPLCVLCVCYDKSQYFPVNIPPAK
jgi:hypothetical protein